MMLIDIEALRKLIPEGWSIAVKFEPRHFSLTIFQGSYSLMYSTGYVLTNYRPDFIREMIGEMILKLRAQEKS